MEQLVNFFTANTAISKVIIVFIGVIIIVTIINLIKKSVHTYVKEQENWYKTRKMINVVGYILAILLVLVIYSDKLGGIPVALGVASAGIAFALQEVIVSIAGWIAVMVGGIFKTGDRVKLGGIKGDVIDLGILRTTIMEIDDWVDGDLYNGRIVKVSNSFIFKEPVFNYSNDFPFLWDEIKIPIKYGSDYDEARAIIERAGNEIIGDYSDQAQQHWDLMVRKFLIENASTKPMVTLVATDNWIEYTLRYVVNYRKRRTIKDQLFTRILTDVENTSGKVEFASSTYGIIELPEVDVNVRTK